jgi:hypothetical protein
MINPIYFLQPKLVPPRGARKRDAARNLSFLFHDARAAVENFRQAPEITNPSLPPAEARKLAFLARIA